MVCRGSDLNENRGGGRQAGKEGAWAQRATSPRLVPCGLGGTKHTGAASVLQKRGRPGVLSNQSAIPVQGPPPPQVERKNTAGPPWLLVSGETSLELRSQPALRGAGAGGAPALQRRRRGSEGAAAATGPSQPRTHALLPPPELPRGSHLQVECKTQSR